MITYFDVPPRERAEMTDEAFGRYMDIALMEAGIPPLTIPELQDVPAVPEPTHPAYGIGDDIWFDTPEKASAYAALKPMRSDYEYSTGYEHKKLVPQCPDGGVVQSKCFYTEAELLALSDLMRTAKTRREENEKALKVYKDAMADRSAAGEALHEDRCEQIAKLNHAKEVKQTFDVYCEMTEGDHKLATKFLHKAYPHLDVALVEEMIGLVLVAD